jgi:hypothetical protein
LFLGKHYSARLAREVPEQSRRELAFTLPNFGLLVRLYGVVESLIKYLRKFASNLPHQERFLQRPAETASGSCPFFQPWRVYYGEFAFFTCHKSLYCSAEKNQ